VAGWGRVVAGVVLGVAGTVYATNEEVRKNLPKAARDLPENVRRRYQSAVSAAREASNRRREEILRDLEAHGGANHAARGVKSDPAGGPATSDPASARTPRPAVQTTENPE
jgi:cation transport regulator ChaB